MIFDMEEKPQHFTIGNRNGFAKQKQRRRDLWFTRESKTSSAHFSSVKGNSDPALPKSKSLRKRMKKLSSALHFAAGHLRTITSVWMYGKEVHYFILTQKKTQQNSSQRLSCSFWILVHHKVVRLRCHCLLHSHQNWLKLQILHSWCLSLVLHEEYATSRAQLASVWGYGWFRNQYTIKLLESTDGI